MLKSKLLIDQKINIFSLLCIGIYTHDYTYYSKKNFSYKQKIIIKPYQIQ